MTPGIDEDEHLSAKPATYVLYTARSKAETIARTVRAGESGRVEALIIAADTTVALGQEILGKPADAAEARRMLVALRGRTHEVHTALYILHAGTGAERHAVHTAAVTMRPYSDAEIGAYIATGDPFDKAGAYAVQHPLFRPVERLRGCYLGVMGLSLCELIPLLVASAVPCQLRSADLLAAHDGYPCPDYSRAGAHCP